MGECWNKYYLLKLTQDKIDNLNRTITSDEVKTVITNLPTKRSPGLDVFRTEFYQTFIELALLKQFFLWRLYSDSKAKERHIRKKYRPISMMNTDVKILYTWKPYLETSERSYAMIKLGSFQKCKDSLTYINQ